MNTLIQQNSSTGPGIKPAFGTIATWCSLSGQTRTKAFEALAAGHLRAVKNGRTTLIDIEHGLAWLRTLPAAKFRSSIVNKAKAA